MLDGSWWIIINGKMGYKLKWYLDLRKLNGEGKGRLCMVIYCNGSSAMVTTGVMLRKGEWVADRVVGMPMADKLTQMLKLKMAKLQLFIEELGCVIDLSGMKASEIKQRVLKAEDESALGCNRDVEREDDTRFKTYADKFLTRIQKEKTREVYALTLKKMAKYVDDIECLMFEDITVGWLKDFEAWMAKSCKVNTRGIHFRNIRAMFNAAIDEGVIGSELYPFRRFRIKKEDTMKRSLRAEDVRRLRDFKCEEWQRKYVDLWLLSFYLCGINMIDLIALPPLGKDGVIEYRRSKTGVVCRLMVPNEALDIIERYKGKRRLLYFGERMGAGLAEWHNWMRRLNDGLKCVGTASHMYVSKRGGGKTRVKVYDALFPELTSYWARHTWATLAAEANVPDAVIDAALGHKSPYPMTDIYVRRNWKKVDEAARRVIAYVNGGER